MADGLCLSSLSDVPSCGVSMKLELTKGYFTEVDAEDFEWASQWSWASAVKRNGVYAVRGKRINGIRRDFFLHREIWSRMGNTLEHQIDHRNRDPLDNRRRNLREATYAQNAQNRQSKGYYYNKVCRKWMAQITVLGKINYIGLFNTEEEAASAVIEWRLKLHGEFACI